MKRASFTSLAVFAAAALPAVLFAQNAPEPTTQSQNVALADVNIELAGNVRAVRDARAALVAASLVQPADAAALAAAVTALGNAERTLALGRADWFSAFQSGADRFSPAQVGSLVAASLGGGPLPSISPANGTQGMKQLLIWADTRNGQAQHDFPSHAMAVIERLGRESGLYETVIRTDTEIISYRPQRTTGGNASGGPSLGNVDAIFSLVHREAPLLDTQREELLRFVREDGKGFLTAHTGLTAFLTWPEFREMVGGGYGGHNIGWDGTLVVEAPDFPAVSHFPARIQMREEWYNLTDYSRDTIRVLLRLDLSTVPSLPESVVANGGDFPVAWAREYGNGRVFASTFAHEASAWDSPLIQQMYFEAIKWALKITDGDATPRPFPGSMTR